MMTVWQEWLLRLNVLESVRMLYKRVEKMNNKVKTNHVGWQCSVYIGISGVSGVMLQSRIGKTKNDVTCDQRKHKDWKGGGAMVEKRGS